MQTSSSLPNKLRTQYNQTVLENKILKEENIKLKKNVSLTKSNEIKIQNEVLVQEMKKIKNLYNDLKSKINEAEDFNKDINILKAEIETQHGIINTLYQKLDNSTKENKTLKKEINLLKDKGKNSQSSNKFLQSENEKLRKQLKLTLKNQIENKDWENEKKQMFLQIEKLTKDLSYYKNQVIIEKAKRPLSSKKNQNIEENKTNNSSILIKTRPPITVSHEAKNPEETMDKQLLLMQSIISELKEENKELKAKNNFLEKQILSYKNIHSNSDKQSINLLVSSKENEPEVTLNRNCTSQLLIDKITNKEDELQLLNEQIKSNSNETLEKYILSFRDILSLNFEYNNITKKSAKKLFSYVLSEYDNNMDKDNDENARDEIISSLVNIISISLHCNNNEKDKKEIYEYLSKIYDEDDNDYFSQNFYEIFENIPNHLDTDVIEKDKINEQNILKTFSLDSLVIQNIFESFPEKININTLNDILYKNNISLTKSEFLFLCYKIKGNSSSIRDLSTTELKNFLSNKK